MATLGELERSVMNLLWASETALTAYDLQTALAVPAVKPLAVTTVLTVLSRLEKKNFVERERSARPHTYRAAAAREDYVAELMHEALGDAPDRVAVLERFIGRASADEAALLRRLLDKN